MRHGYHSIVEQSSGLHFIALELSGTHGAGIFVISIIKQFLHMQPCADCLGRSKLCASSVCTIFSVSAGVLPYCAAGMPHHFPQMFPRPKERRNSFSKKIMSRSDSFVVLCDSKLSFSNSRIQRFFPGSLIIELGVPELVVRSLFWMFSFRKVQFIVKEVRLAASFSYITISDMIKMRRDLRLHLQIYWRSDALWSCRYPNPLEILFDVIYYSSVLYLRVANTTR